jgi:methyl-accepting chemotaxis protein PixJ
MNTRPNRNNPRNPQNSNGNGNGNGNGRKQPLGSSTSPVSKKVNMPSNGNGNGNVANRETDSKKTSSFANQVLKTILPVVLAPLAIAGAISWVLINNQIGKNAEVKLGNDATVSAQMTGKVIKEAQNITTTLAANPLLISTLRVNPKPLPNQPAITPTLPSFQNYLQQVGKEQNFSQIVITDNNGTPVTGTGNIDQGNQANNDWWKKAKTDNQWVSAPKSEQNQTVIEISQAIKDPVSGEFLGAIKGVITPSQMDSLTSSVSNLGLGSSEKIQIISPGNKAVINTINAKGSNSNQELLGGEVVLQKANALLTERDDKKNKAAGNNNAGKLPDFTSNQESLKGLKISQIANNKGEFILTTSFDYQGKKYTLAVAPGVDLVTVTEINLSEIGGMGGEGIIYILVCLGLGGIAAGVVVSLARHWSGELNRLNYSSEALASGDLDVYIEAQESSETQSLASSFNSLVVRIKDLLYSEELTVKREDLITQIVNNTRQSGDINSIFNQAVTGLKQLLDADRVFLYRFNPDWSGEVIAESVNSGITSCLNMKIADSYFATSNITEMYRTGKVFVVDDIYTENLTPCHRELYEKMQVKATIVNPLISGNQLLGLICAQQCTEPRNWLQSEIDFSTQLSNQLGLALDQIKYLEQKELEAKRSQILAEVANSAREGAKVIEIFQKAVTQTQKLLKTERVSIYKFNPDWSGEIVAEIAAPGVPECINMTVADTYFTDSDKGVELYQKGRVFVINDIYETKLTPCHREVYEHLKIRAIIITPIVGGDKLWGLMCTQQYSTTRNWEESEVSFCSQIATQVGLALDRISYFEQKEIEAKKQETEAKQAQLFAEIATSARQSSDIEFIFQRAVQETQQLLNVERVSVYKFNEDWSGEIVAEAAGIGIPPCLNMTVADTYFTDSDAGVERYKNGRVFVINDVYKANLTPCHLQVYERLKIRAIIITPIVGGDKLLGLMCTQQYANPRLWQQSEVNFCQQLATQVGLALDRISYFEQKELEAKKQETEAKQAQLFAEIASNARQASDIEFIFQKAVQETQQLLNVERVSVYKFNEDWSGEIVAEAAGIGIPPCLNMTVADTYFTDSDAGVERYKNGRVFVINDVYKANLTPCHLQVYERLKIRAIIITPIVGGNKLLGLMCTQQYANPRMWQQSEVNFCQQLATQVGLALDRISYFEQQESEAKKQESEAKQSQLFAEIANSARQASDIDLLFQKAVQGTQQLLNAERVSVYKFNPDWSGEIVAEAAGIGIPPCLNMTVADTYFTDSDAGVDRYRNGRVFVINDVYKASLTPCHLQVYERLKIRAVVITPIVGGGKLLGLMCTQQYSAPRTWQQSEVNFCQQLATQMGLALDRISFFEQKEIEAKKQETEAKQAQLFAEIATSARQSSDIEFIFQRAVQETQQLLNVERVSVYKFNPDWSGEIVAEAASVGIPPCLNMTVADTYFTDSDAGVERYKNGRVFVINDVYKANLTPCHLQVYERLKIRAIIITPIVGGDKLLGLMCTQQYSAPRTWLQSEVNFCQQLATQVGLALDRISYFEQKEIEAKKQEIEAKQAQLFAEIATSARQSSDIEFIFQRAVQETQQLLTVERVSVYKFNPDWSGEIVAEAAGIGIPPCLNMTVADTYFTDSDAGIERYKNGRVFVINDVYKANLTPCHLQVYERLKIRAIIITPIVGGDKLLGLMCTQQYSAPRTWLQSEVNFCQQLATQVGLALDRISYFEQKELEAKKQESEAKQAQLFAELANSARQASDIDLLFQKAVTATQQLLNVERVSVYKFNPDWSGEIVAEAAGIGIPPCLNMTVADSYFTDSDAGVDRYRNGRVFVVNDVYKANLTPCHLQVYERLKIRAIIITPIVGGGKLLGLMCTQQYANPRTWQQSEVNFCTQLATQVGLALDRISYFEQKELEAKKQESEAKQAQLFADIASSARESLDINAVFNKAVQSAQQLINAERVFVYKFNSDWTGTVISESCLSGIASCLGVNISDSYFTESDKGVQTYRQGKVLVINDIYQANLTRCHLEMYERIKIRANIVAPIISGDKLIGLLCTQQCQTMRVWQQSEVNFCTQLATQIGLALDRISYLEQKEIEAKRAQLFADIATSARESLDVNTVFNKAVLGALQLVNAERVFVYRFNTDWTGNIIAESVAPGISSCLNMKVTDTYFTDSDKGVELYRKGRIYVINDIYEANLSPCHLELYERLQIKANVITPIVSGDKLLGLLCTQQSKSRRSWQKSEIDFCAQLSTQIGLALDRISYLEQKESEAKRAQLLSDITLKLRESLKLEDILNTAVRELRLAFNTDRVLVYRFDSEWNGTVISESLNTGIKSLINVEIEDSCLKDTQGGSYNKGRVRAIENIHQSNLTQCHIKMLEDMQVKANLVVPMMVDNKLFGLLIGHQCTSTRTWQKAEIDLFTQLGTQVGLALNQAMLVEQIQTLLAAQEEATRQQAENAEKQRLAKEALQKRALELLMEVEPVSKGNLTIRAQVTEDEIGTIADSYNATIASLRKIVTQVQDAAKQVAATTSGNEVAVQELSTEALRQAEEILAALDQIQKMSNSIRAVTTNAEQAEAAVQEATKIVKEGDTAMNRTVDGILAIRETVAETSKKVKRLGESSQKISKVVNLISTFAAQTNLLALNASIEAARAGEEGRGFAVVADEVRSLARQSAAATAEIEQLVAGIQAETNEVVAAMEAGTEQVVEGTKLVDETRQSLNKITTASAQISALVEAIAQAAAIQSQASDAVTQTMSNVAEIANKTSVGASKVSSSFLELMALAQELQATVGQFKIN